MRKVILFLALSQISLLNYGQIIADHTVIDKFDDIPAFYINEVKKMMIAFPGESHSAAYRTGMELLEAENSVYSCNVAEGENYTDQHVRVENLGWVGEIEWYTWYAYASGSRPSVGNYIKNTITSYKNAGHPFRALGFGWCNDLTSSDYISATADPVYGVRWYGRSDGGPDGSKASGLDAGDYSITGNRVSLATYLSAMEEYIAHCTANSPSTKMIFTTGPVDVTYGEFSGECGYQGHLKYEAIRNYVKENASRILFDYNDILSYDNDGTQTTQTWNGHTFPLITPTNFGDASIGHISSTGAIRLAKAQWWLLARIAGWDGGSSTGIENTWNSEYHIVQFPGMLNIRSSIPSAELMTNCSIYSIHGTLLHQEKITSAPIELDISAFASGIYLISLSNDRRIIPLKVAIP